jgi:hypothetical protein
MVSVVIVEAIGVRNKVHINAVGLTVALMKKHGGLIEFGRRAFYIKLLLIGERFIRKTGMSFFCDYIQDRLVIQLTIVGTGDIHQILKTLEVLVVCHAGLPEGVEIGF